MWKGTDVHCECVQGIIAKYDDRLGSHSIIMQSQCTVKKIYWQLCPQWLCKGSSCMTYELGLLHRVASTIFDLFNSIGI